MENHFYNIRWSPLNVTIFITHVRNSVMRANVQNPHEGAQWLSGRVLDSRLRGPGFEPHLRHVVLEQDTFILA